MKIAGWIFVVLAILNLIAFILGTAYGYADAVSTKLGGAIMLGVLGVYLIDRGKQKKQEKQDKNKWNNGGC